jgi:hypothetical protein
MVLTSRDLLGFNHDLGPLAAERSPVADARRSSRCWCNLRTGVLVYVAMSALEREDLHALDFDTILARLFLQSLTVHTSADGQ